MRMNGRNVFVIGTGITKFGEFYGRDSTSLAVEALNAAIDDAKIDRSSIKSAYFGSMVSNSSPHSSFSSKCLRECNISIPFTRVEAGNASGAAVFHQAYTSLASGIHDCVAVIGSEKLSDFVKNGTIEKILGSTIDYQWEYEIGATLTSLYALITKAHMREFHTTMEQLASVPVKNHKNGKENPHAQFRREIPLDRFLSAKRISDPIGRFDLATHCDGSSALILVSEDYLERNNEIKNKIPILSSEHSSDVLALHHRESLTQTKSTVTAAKKAFTKVGIEPTDIAVAEVHDAFPISEILAIDDLGFFEKGEGGNASEAGLTQLNSKISVNPSGGLKARGDPFGATGIAQIVEIVEQLRGRADKRQVREIEYGLTHNIMGTGALAYVNIFGQEEMKQ